MRNPEAIHNRELEIIAENPDVLGCNVDSLTIVSPEKRKAILELNANIEAGRTSLEQFAEEYGRTQEEVKKAIVTELNKTNALAEDLAKLPSGTKFRIHPHAPESPFSIANAVKKNKAGQIIVHFDDEAMKQIKIIKEKTGDTELTVVMNQFHFNSSGEVTSNIPDEPTDYIALCCAFVEQSGYGENAGKGLVLELGNECNVGHEHGGGFDSEAFTERVDPEAYANMYYETAKALKADFPDLKLSLAGVAFHDPDFIKKVASTVESRKTADGVVNNLIDVISFHPYRRTVAEGSRVVKGNNFVKNGKTFDEQLAELREIAKPLGAEVTVGEISFYKGKWGESIDVNEQTENAAHGREKGYFSYIWPGESIVLYD